MRCASFQTSSSYRRINARRYSNRVLLKILPTRTIAHLWALDSLALKQKNRASSLYQRTPVAKTQNEWGCVQAPVYVGVSGEDSTFPDCHSESSVPPMSKCSLSCLIRSGACRPNVVHAAWSARTTLMSGTGKAAPAMAETAAMAAFRGGPYGPAVRSEKGPESSGGGWSTNLYASSLVE